MANVNPPPIKIPPSLLSDPEMQTFFRALVMHLQQLWRRTGGADDFFEGVTVTGKYPGAAGAVNSAVAMDRMADIERQLITPVSHGTLDRLIELEKQVSGLRVVQSQLMAAQQRIDELEKLLWA